MPDRGGQVATRTGLRRSREHRLRASFRLRIPLRRARPAAFSREPGIRMIPLSASRTASGERCSKASRLGAREAPESWHAAQFCL